MKYSLLLLFFVMGCNVKSESNDQKYTYSFTVNDCPTHEQSFSSFDAYCAGLKNDTLNNNCARYARREQFKAAGCPGDFDSGN